MKLVATNPLPDNDQMIALLRKEFSGACTYEQFGLEERKSILVRQSTFVGAQISIRDNEITIQATPPSVAAGNGAFFLSIIGVDIVFGLLFSAKLKQIERNLAVFLKTKFG